jgi:hypothetical protein
VKIFTSYFRSDARDFAVQIRAYLMGGKRKIDVFIDIDNIKAGDVWTDTIATNISNCDIFVVIVTYGALDSPNVEREVLQAQREKKTIIPCFRTELGESERAKWGLNKIEGVEFDDKYELARNLYSMILQYEKIKINDNTDTSKVKKDSHVGSLESDQDSEQWGAADDVRDRTLPTPVVDPLNLKRTPPPSSYYNTSDFFDTSLQNSSFPQFQPQGRWQVLNLGNGSSMILQMVSNGRFQTFSPNAFVPRGDGIWTFIPGMNTLRLQWGPPVPFAIDVVIQGKNLNGYYGVGSDGFRYLFSPV